MEILIAMAIIMVGILPMLAVFKVALNNLNRAIEDTYASMIAQSVVDSIRFGLKETKVTLNAGSNNETTLFLLDCDGAGAVGYAGLQPTDPKLRRHLELDRLGFLKDADISQPGNAQRLLVRDYCVMLPRATEVEAPPQGEAGTKVGTKFLYPPEKEGQRTRLGPPVDVTLQSGQKVKKPRITRTYLLGRDLELSLRDAKTGAAQVEQNDVLKQYSFAFTIARAKAPDPMSVKQNEWDPRFQNVTADMKLYEVVVKVYRNFNENPTSPKNDPIREFLTYIAD